MAEARANIPINHDLLRWAREDAGLSLEEAADKADIKALKPRGESPGVEAWQRLERWESGQETPTANQLMQVAKAYKRPILTFFLKNPPPSDSNLEDYRTIGDRLTQDMYSPEFKALVRRIEALQKSVKQLIRDQGSSPLQFVGSVKVTDPVKKTVNLIREDLNFSFHKQRKIASKDVLLRVIRRKAERLGIFVVAEGNLGNYHTDIDPTIFRGLVISDPIAPFIVINPKDSKAARVFTLVHELAHLWLGDVGVSNLDSLSIDIAGHSQKEKYCNEIAAEFLVPGEALREIWESSQIDDHTVKLDIVAKQFKVSPICLARRLVDFNLMMQDRYWSYYKLYIKRLEAIKKKQKEHDDPINQKNLIRFRLGEKLIHTVIDAANNGRISELDASQLLRVKINKFMDIYPQPV